MKEIRQELTAHVGGKPSAVKRILIDRAAILALRLALMDARAPGGNLTERDAREYLCWHNCYVRTLAALGVEATPEPEKSWWEQVQEAREANQPRESEPA